MAQVQFYGTGRRKNAIARVYLVPGKGEVRINARNADAYLGRRTLETIVRQPLEVTGTSGRFDVVAKVLGGG
ncbi:30S ribosomal protein S9, partial [Desulforudis sp. 1190]